MAQRHVAVHSERDGGPDGGVVCRKLSSTDRVQQQLGDIAVEDGCLQEEAHEDDEELGQDVRARHCQQVVVKSFLSP